ncbi:MAG: hypothetical protein HYR56_11335 [Acidobacteria bacterium]|nr:hypothetical protein [Acidobacteriota bacterium]MBI3422165.1 hypothetical protein [Acidobacteriota bacterium]
MRRTKITIVTRELLSVQAQPISSPAAVTEAWCAACAARVVWLTPDEAAAAAGYDTRQVYRWIEAGALHFSEAVAAAPRLCLPALLRWAQTQTADAGRGCLPAPADAA